MIRIISIITIVLGFMSVQAGAMQVGQVSQAPGTEVASNDNEILKLLTDVMENAATPEFGQPCGRSSECGSGESCVNSVCQTSYGGAGCVGDYQCPVGERCSNGTCK